MRRTGSRPEGDPSDAALAELRDRAEEIRDAVRVRVLTAGNLRHAAESANETAEDVAQAVFLKLWALVRDGNPAAIGDLKAYAKKMADNHVTSQLRRPSVSRTYPSEPEVLDRLATDPTSATSPEDAIEHRLSAAQVESIVARLNPRQRLLFKMRVELGMTVPEMAEVVGESPKSCAKHLERAIETVRTELAAAEDLDAADRRRLSRVLAAKRWGTPALIASLQRDIQADLRLASLWRRSNGAMHDVASTIAVDESLSRLGGRTGLTDRALGLVERGREVVAGTVGRGGPEQEAAAGAAAGSAGFVTKAVVAACIAGPAAGGACVAGGIVDLPNGEPAAGAEQTVPVEDTSTVVGPVADQSPPGPETATVSPPPEKPVQRVNNELGLGATNASGSASSASTRDFPAPPAASGGGSGGGGSGGNAGGFGFEK